MEGKSKRREITTIPDRDLNESHVGGVDSCGERVGEFLGDADARCCRHGIGRGKTVDLVSRRCWDMRSKVSWAV